MQPNVRLSNKFEFPYFFRVLPRDQFSSIAVAELVRHFGWEFVSLVYTDDPFGVGGEKSVRAQLEKLTPKVCVSLSQKIDPEH